MFGGMKPHGFTIVETLIFLAVSGLMFVSVLAYIGGKSGQTEFDQGIHSVFSQLQSIPASVSAGEYTNDYNNFLVQRLTAHHQLQLLMALCKEGILAVLS